MTILATFFKKADKVHVTLYDDNTQRAEVLADRVEWCEIANGIIIDAWVGKQFISMRADRVQGDIV